MVAIDLHLLISQIVSLSPEINLFCFGLRSKVELVLNSKLKIKLKLNNPEAEMCYTPWVFRNLHLSATKEVKHMPNFAS